MHEEKIKIGGLSAVNVKFESFTGTVAGARSSTETHVSGHGGSINPHVYAQQGGISINSTIVRRSSFWLVGDDGSEVEIRLTHDFPVRDGHEVSVVWAKYRGGGSPYIYVVNHTAGGDFTYAKKNAEVLGPLVTITPDGPTAILIALYAAAVAGAVWYWPGAMVAILLLAAFITLPILFTIKNSAVADLSRKVVNTAVNRIYAAQVSENNLERATSAQANAA